MSYGQPYKTYCISYAIAQCLQPFDCGNFDSSYSVASFIGMYKGDSMMYELTIIKPKVVKTVLYGNMDDAIARIPKLILAEPPSRSLSWEFFAPFKCRIKFSDTHLEIQTWNDIKLKKRWIEALMPLLVKELE